MMSQKDTLFDKILSILLLIALPIYVTIMINPFDTTRENLTKSTSELVFTILTGLTLTTILSIGATIMELVSFQKSNKNNKSLLLKTVTLSIVFIICTIATAIYYFNIQRG